ncbi:insulin-like growth factor-binding protein 2-B [Gouania willdenowi]|uniref:insulin-like growth factor-binding protein 2-B n=1 Tax=Gouania willdenowi TaxID=441366 RepID=UPI0010557894|nr:insulin-like growth factor-binding protein 2-B [Gouania willdenowi]
MVTFLTYSLLLGYLLLPGLVFGDLAFRCPSCTAEQMVACPKVDAMCSELVREPGCGCCPLCARMEGELCGVYTPRCSTGLRCYPTIDADFPLQQLIQGFGRCGHRDDPEITESVVNEPTNEVQGTENPLNKRPVVDTWIWQETARKQHQNDCKTKLKTNQEEPRIQRIPQSACEQELEKVLEDISKMTSEDNRGPLENLYELKFPNCDRQGLYNLKQCNMSTHGQRGECWCVNPLTGVQIPTTPKVRGDPNCNQFEEVLRAIPTAASSQ